VTYIIERFGNLPISALEAQQDIGTHEAQVATAILPGGGQYDAYGDEIAPLVKRDIPVTAVFAGSGWQTQYRALRAAIGKRGWLYRRDEQDDAVHKIMARLMRVQTRRTKKDFDSIQAQLVFLPLSPQWYGQEHLTWTFDSGYYFDDGLVFDDSGISFTLDTTPKYVTVNNGGNARVTSVKATITAGSAAITSLSVARQIGATTYEKWIYNGTIAIGKSLVVDCGALSVVNDGSEDYANLSWSTLHKTDDWLRLEPGDNTIEVQRVGGGVNSVIVFEFRDGER
jgi:hypothetical protein